jgi:hypothetical protein
MQEVVKADTSKNTANVSKRQTAFECFLQSWEVVKLDTSVNLLADNQNMRFKSATSSGMSINQPRVIPTNNQ